MRGLLLLCLFVAVVASFPFKPTVVGVNLVLRCQKPWSNEATVFLMEKDTNIFGYDDDDTLDFSNYYFGRVPEFKMELQGAEWETDGLEPYLRVIHPCTSESGSHGHIDVSLMKGMLKSRVFEIVMDLDAGRTTVIQKFMFP